jgi:DNA-binding protein HU-beta
MSQHMDTINKEQIVEQIQQKFDLSKATSRAILAEILDQITTAVANGNRVTFMGFGTFEPAHAKERKGQNILTRDPIVIPATVRPKFKPGADFVTKVRDSFKGEA